MTLIEVMIASGLALGITVTSVASVVYYQKTTVKNDKANRLANLMEALMERILNQTWYSLANQTNGIFPPGGPTAPLASRYVWPKYNEPSKFVRYKCNALSIPLLDNSPLSAEYNGLNGSVEVFYTPFEWTHTATTKDGASVAFDVKYYKVEVVVSLLPTSRITPLTSGAPDPEVWTLVCYISELGGRTDATFSNNILSAMRDRLRAV